MATSRQVEVDGRELKLTNLDKVLYPEAGFTKGEVVDYYAKVAPAIVPHLAGRALTLRRFPEGVDDTDAAFFEKRCPKHRPEWVRTAAVEAGPHAGVIDFCVCEDRATLVWMAQLAAIGAGLATLARLGRIQGIVSRAILNRLQRDGAIAIAVRVAVRSDEVPADLVAHADVVVDGPAGVAALLAELGARLRPSLP